MNVKDDEDCVSIWLNNESTKSEFLIVYDVINKIGNQ